MRLLEIGASLFGCRSHDEDYKRDHGEFLSFRGPCHMGDPSYNPVYSLGECSSRQTGRLLRLETRA